MHTLGEIARWIDGTIKADAQLRIRATCPLKDAGPEQITFVESEKYLPDLQASNAAAAIVKRGIDAGRTPVIEVDDPFRAFATVVERFRGAIAVAKKGIHPASFVSDSATVGRNSYVGAHASVGEGSTIGDRCRIHPGVQIGDYCKIGDDTELHPNVVVYPNTKIGNRVTVHACTVVGSDGYGYRQVDGVHVKNPQLGDVVIEDDVEIGANSTIDRGTFHTTRIGAGTKIDNQVQIAHNCQIGQHNLIVAQVGIAGSTRTGNQVIIAGGAGIKDNLNIGDGAVIMAMAGVMRDVAEGERVVGIPATPEREQMKTFAAVHNLPKLRQLVRQLVRDVDSIKDGDGPVRKSA